MRTSARDVCRGHCCYKFGQGIAIALNPIKEYLEERNAVIGRNSSLSSGDDDEVTVTAFALESKSSGSHFSLQKAGAVASARKHPSDLTEQDVRNALAKHQGNKTRAAKELSVSLNTFKDRMRRFGVVD